MITKLFAFVSQKPKLWPQKHLNNKLQIRHGTMHARFEEIRCQNHAGQLQNKDVAWSQNWLCLCCRKLNFAPKNIWITCCRFYMGWCPSESAAKWGCCMITKLVVLVYQKPRLCLKKIRLKKCRLRHWKSLQGQIPRVLHWTPDPLDVVCGGLFVPFE